MPKIFGLAGTCGVPGIFYLHPLHRIQLMRPVDETSFLVAYVNVCRK